MLLGERVANLRTSLCESLLPIQGVSDQLSTPDLQGSTTDDRRTSSQARH